MFPSSGFVELRDGDVEFEEDEGGNANLLTLVNTMSSLLEGAFCNLREPKRMCVNFIEVGSSARSVEK